MQICNTTTTNATHLEQPVCELRTHELRTDSSTAANIKLKEILKRRALFGDQRVELVTHSVALANSGASKPSLIMRHAWTSVLT